MLLSLGIVIALMGAQDPTPAADTPLPAAIREYYQDYNFVISFSTSRERQGLVSNSRARESVTDPRLEAVRERMARLAEQVRELDPGIFLRSGPPAAALDTALLEIRSHQVDSNAGEAWVELDVIAVGPGWNAQLIADYARLESGKDATNLAANLSKRLKVAQARHRWVRAGDGWLRDSVTRVLISR